MAIVIRKYQGKDKKHLRKFILGLQEYIAEMDEFKRIRKVEDFDLESYIKATLEKLKKMDGVIYVAEENGNVLGGIIGVMNKKEGTHAIEAYPTKDGHILELFVSEEARGKGVGKLLINHMENHFREAGCEAVILECFAPNHNARGFYKNLGYVERSISNLKKLKDRDTF